MQFVKLQSSDNDIFTVNIEVAKKSETIRKMLELLQIDNNNLESEIVPLPNVNSSILQKIIQFCTHHKDEYFHTNTDENRENEKNNDNIDAWVADFLSVDQGTIFELILAANYLEIRFLLNVLCKTVANMIKGRSPNEIRNTFNIKNDFTLEEEEQIRKENTWCEEK